MAEHSIVQLAKQGDPKAIADLITHRLQKYGITARANRQGLCLKLLLESEQVPHQTTMVKLVTQGMQKLDVETLQMVKLYGRQQGQPTAAWRHVIELLPQSPYSPPLEAGDLALNGAAGASETPLFQMDDLDPNAMILVPIDPQVQFDDLDPESLILFPVEPLAARAQGSQIEDSQMGNSQIEDSSEWPTAARLSPIPLAPTDTYPAADEAGSDPALGASLLPSGELSKLEAIRPTRLPQRLTLLLLCLLWFSLLTNTLGLIVSLLKAVSFSLYAGLDLSSTNQPFAGLLLAVVGLAGFIFTPFSRLSLGLTLGIVLLSLGWLHRIHTSLSNLLGQYPISPNGAVARFVLPIYQVWGIGQVWLTLSHRLAQLQLKQPSQVIRRLTGWLYLALGATIGLQAGAMLMAERFVEFFGSFWFNVLRDAAIWILSLVWLRLVRTTWRALRRLHKTRMAPFVLSKPLQPSPPFNLSAILLGGGASLLSLGLFNCLLGLLAALVFLSNGLRPESIFPTFYDSESLLILMLSGSFFCVSLGGFLTAYWAQRSCWLHALGLGLLLTLIGLALRHLPLFPALTELPFWFQTAGTMLIIPATLLGCGLRQWFRSL